MGLIERMQTSGDAAAHCPNCRERLPSAIWQYTLCGRSLAVASTEAQRGPAGDAHAR